MEVDHLSSGEILSSMGEDSEDDATWLQKRRQLILCEIKSIGWSHAIAFADFILSLVVLFLLNHEMCCDSE